MFSLSYILIPTSYYNDYRYTKTTSPNTDYARTMMKNIYQFQPMTKSKAVAVVLSVQMNDYLQIEARICDVSVERSTYCYV